VTLGVIGYKMYQSNKEKDWVIYFISFRLLNI